MISLRISQNAYIWYTLCIVRTCNIFLIDRKSSIDDGPGSGPALGLCAMHTWDVYLTLPTSRPTRAFGPRPFLQQFSARHSHSSAAKEATQHRSRWLWCSGKRAGRKVALQRDSNQVPQVYDISANMLLSMHRIRFYVIYRSWGSYAIFYYVNHHILAKLIKLYWMSWIRGYQHLSGNQVS